LFVWLGVIFLGLVVESDCNEKVLKAGVLMDRELGVSPLLPIQAGLTSTHTNLGKKVGIASVPTSDPIEECVERNDRPVEPRLTRRRERELVMGDVLEPFPQCDLPDCNGLAHDRVS
jgi:hypothetical protein